jgi:hypothetical protein
MARRLGYVRVTCLGRAEWPNAMYAKTPLAGRPGCAMIEVELQHDAAFAVVGMERVRGDI